MGEVFPRWGLKEVNFIEIDTDKIATEIITGYEAASGRTLAAGDPVRLFLLSIADRIVQLRQCINFTGQQNLLSYAQGDALDALGLLLDTERLDAATALTSIQFKLVQAMATDFVIPLGFEVTNGVVTFATDEELIIPAGEIYGEISAYCTTAGVAGNNYLPGQINTIVKPLAYLESARNTSTSSGGTDAEGDADYAERLRMATSKFSVAGALAAYEYHAASVNPAIIDVSVISPNPCEVEIYPLLTGGTMPTEEILDQVTEYFAADDIIPLTDLVTVKAPTAYEYAINVDYYINADDLAKAEAIRSAVAAAVEDYRLWQQTKVGRPITPDELIHKVKAAGAAYVDLTTLSPANFVKISGGTVAQCTDVTVTYKGLSE